MEIVNNLIINFTILGPAVSLFQLKYFEHMKRALKPNGVVCSQGGTVWSNIDTVAECLDHCRSIFPTAAFAVASVPTYPTGQIGFVMGSLNQVCNVLLI